MSVWPETICHASALVGSEGALVLVSIHTAPRLLENLLETLAELDFPVNPQIYHDAAVVYVFADGAERTEPATLVEFPAYQSRIPGLHQALQARGFDPDAITVSGMLDDSLTEGPLEPAPAGAGYRARRLRKVAGLIRTTPLQ